MPPLTRTILSTMKRMFGQEPLILSYWRNFNRPIIWSFVRSYGDILQHSRSLFNSRIQTQNTSQVSMPLHRKTVALNRTSFVRVLFHMRLFGNSCEPYSFFWSHEYFLAFVCAPIVTAAKAFNPGELKITYIKTCQWLFLVYLTYCCTFTIIFLLLPTTGTYD